MDTRAVLILCCLVASCAAAPGPDSGGIVPLPGPGIAYGGIPYGSVSGNVAAFERQQAAASRGRTGRLVNGNLFQPNFAPIEPWLR